MIRAALALLLASSAAAQPIPDLREVDPQGNLRYDNSTWAPGPVRQGHAATHKIVAPQPRPTPTPTPVPEGRGILARLGEKIELLSTLEAGTWTGGRYRGKGTLEGTGGAYLAVTTKSGWKLSGLFGGDSIGAAIGRSRFGIGAEYSRKIWLTAVWQPLRF